MGLWGEKKKGAPSAEGRKGKLGCNNCWTSKRFFQQVRGQGGEDSEGLFSWTRRRTLQKRRYHGRPRFWGALTPKLRVPKKCRRGELGALQPVKIDREWVGREPVVVSEEPVWGFAFLKIQPQKKRKGTAKLRKTIFQQTEGVKWLNQN